MNRFERMIDERNVMDEKFSMQKKKLDFITLNLIKGSENRNFKTHWLCNIN